MIQIKQNLESLSIQTQKAELFCELQALMKKNFTKTLGQKDKIISFYDTNEEQQRKYFFKFITKLCEKQGINPPNLLMSKYATIKLHYKQQNSLKVMIFADISFLKNCVKFTINSQNRLFLGYIAQKFKNSSYKINDKSTSLTVEILNANDLRGLDELLSRNEHLKFIVKFNYDKELFDKFKRELNIKNSQKFINRFLALAELFEEHFISLGCDVKDSFEHVRSSYLELVKLYHPDRHINKSENIKRVYRAKFEKIQNAYENLKPYFKEQELHASAG